MSIMGSETAHFGFGKGTSDLVESSFEDGREVKTDAQQGNGLDKAAAAVEMWLRGALARGPTTPMGGALGNMTRSPARSQRSAQDDSIEMVDTYSDDGRMAQEATMTLANSMSLSTGGRGNGEGAVRGRIISSGSKARKDD
jgi:hypothetical protein